MRILSICMLLTVAAIGCSSGEDVPISAAQATDAELAKAITDGDTAKVTAILNANPQLATSANSVGETPLHYAARANNAEMVKLLLEKGARPDARNGDEETPAQVGATAGASQEVLQLLQGGQ